VLFEGQYSHDDSSNDCDDSSNDCDDMHDMTDFCSLLCVPRGFGNFKLIFSRLNASLRDTPCTFFMHLATEISIILIEYPTAT
jgi:hypothetical protein